MKKILAMVVALVLALSMFAVASAETKTIKVGAVTDVGGVNDKSFNQTTREGLQAFAAEHPGVEVSYLESKADSDYAPNIETFLDEDYAYRYLVSV